MTLCYCGRGGGGRVVANIGGEDFFLLEPVFSHDGETQAPQLGKLPDKQSTSVAETANEQSTSDPYEQSTWTKKVRDMGVQTIEVQPKRVQ